MKVVITDKLLKKIFFIALGVVVFVILIVAIVQSFNKGHVSSNSTIMKDVAPTGKYLKYLQLNNYQDENLYPTETIELKAKDATLIAGSTNETYFKEITSNHIHKQRNDQGVEQEVSVRYDEITDTDSTLLASDASDKVIYMGATGSATWEFNVPQDGFYNILLDYVAEQSGGANIERKFVVDEAKDANGNYIPPYDALLNVSFQRVWGDAPGADIITDINGNQIKPEQAEYFFRRQVYAKDSVGYVTEPYLVFFEAGNHKLTIEAVRECMSIYNVYLTPKEHYDSYQTVYNGWIADGIKVVDKDNMDINQNEWTIQGEDSTYRSSSTLYAVSDRSSKFNHPADHVKILLNVIGGAKWSTSGDWISWNVNVPVDGLYKISLRCKQNSSRGLFAVRTVSINNEIPFAEAKNCKFNYSANYSIVTLGNSDGDFYFHLHQGENIIALEASLGDYGSEINSVQTIIDNLNNVYRQIIAITGTSPDNYINYKLKERLTELFDD